MGLPPIYNILYSLPTGHRGPHEITFRKEVGVLFDEEEVTKCVVLFKHLLNVHG